MTNRSEPEIIPAWLDDDTLTVVWRPEAAFRAADNPPTVAKSPTRPVVKIPAPRSKSDMF